MNKLKSILSWVIPIVVGILLALAIKTFWVTPVNVDGTSMQPNLQSSEHMYVFKQSKVKRGSVIIFNAHDVAPNQGTNTQFVKRVIALPGDTVRYTTDGKLYVNDKLQSQSYISQTERKAGTTSVTGAFDLASLSKEQHWKRDVGVTKVPKNKVFVMGDHRSVSYDSRYWGYVPEDKIIGVAKVGFWESDAAKVNHFDPSK
ncbi:signal peptidase I [Levilactobacillus bambusae]|uniref:Signal peptidase I n=1 Tax=Levilactobacillus bambusae TaxID=2024736 RepID=A0A2V1MZL4_9LACO|nr:signal peptidase I [Levilactobacillus bambusae]PWG00203.1 signal peptidase I [Levilactobacillus bambusae]